MCVFPKVNFQIFIVQMAENLPSVSLKGECTCTSTLSRDSIESQSNVVSVYKLVTSTSSGAYVVIDSTSLPRIKVHPAMPINRLANQRCCSTPSFSSVRRPHVFSCCSDQKQHIQDPVGTMY